MQKSSRKITFALKNRYEFALEKVIWKEWSEQAATALISSVILQLIGLIF